MEGSIHHEQRTLQTESDVLQSYQLTSHLPNNDEHDFRTGITGRMAYDLHGRHLDPHGG